MATKENRQASKIVFEVKKELGVLAEVYGGVKVAKVGKWSNGKWNNGELGLDLRIWYEKEGSKELLPGKGIFFPLSSLQAIVKEKIIEKAIKLIEK